MLLYLPNCGGFCLERLTPKTEGWPRCPLLCSAQWVVIFSLARIVVVDKKPTRALLESRFEDLWIHIQTRSLKVVYLLLCSSCLLPSGCLASLLAAVSVIFQVTGIACFQGFVFSVVSGLCNQLGHGTFLLATAAPVYHLSVAMWLSPACTWTICLGQRRFS